MNSIATIARQLPTGRSVRGCSFIGFLQMPQSSVKPNHFLGNPCRLSALSLWTAYEDCPTPGGSA